MRSNINVFYFLSFLSQSVQISVGKFHFYTFLFNWKYFMPVIINAYCHSCWNRRHCKLERKLKPRKFILMFFRNFNSILLNISTYYKILTSRTGYKIFWTRNKPELIFVFILYDSVSFAASLLINLLKYFNCENIRRL